MSYWKLMLGTDCFANGTRRECEGILQMHHTKIGGKEHKAFNSTFTFVEVEGTYPPPAGQEPQIILNYKPGKA
jgi:hypothetical protein